MYQSLAPKHFQERFTARELASAFFVENNNSNNIKNNNTISRLATCVRALSLGNGVFADGAITRSKLNLSYSFDEV
jgi:hypothetical protein